MRKAYSDPHVKGFAAHEEALQQIEHILIAPVTFSVLRRGAGSFLFPIWWSLTLAYKPQPTSVVLLHPSIL